MPKLNLRLTDAQHAELERWAAGSNRSLQREVVYRLFYADMPKRPGAGQMIPAELTEGAVATAAVSSGDAAVREDRVGVAPASGSAPSASSALIKEPGDVPAALEGLGSKLFRPDPKPSSQKKGRK